MQNLGMWKAYGLLYRLLSNGIPVRWAISSTKTTTSDIDFSVTSVKDKRTGTALGQWDYRGGPFIIESQYAAQAMPIIQAFWAAQGNQPNVHEAQVANRSRREACGCARRAGSRRARGLVVTSSRPG